jgi:hypothetical protein
MTIECPATPSFTPPIAIDICDPSPVITFMDANTPGPCPEEYTITRTWTATDACGNISSSVSQTITVMDDTAPTASNPDSIKVFCISDVPAPDPLVVTDEADNCSIPSVSFVSDVSSGTACPEMITRTYSVSDACGNQILVSQIIYVNDTIPPTASNPAPVFVQCLEDVSVPDTTAVIDEADNCSGTILVAFVGDSIAGNCPKIILRTFSITDNCGNQILVTQTITVNDTIPPTASNPATVTVQCIEDLPPPDINAVTDEADNCTGSLVVAFAGDNSNGASCPETITRTFSVTDGCGNQIFVTQTIIVDDDILPTASNPAPISVQCIEDVPAPNINDVTDESDNCTGPVSVAFVSDVSNGGTCPKIITRTYSVTDACGNQILVTQVITIDDTIPPTASNPAPVSVNCINEVPVPNISVVTDEADNCTGAILVAFVNDVSSGTTCPQIISRTYSVTDACNNQINVTQTITVDDNILPTASNPLPISVQCRSDIPAPDISVVTNEADNCTGAIVVVFVSDVSDGLTCPETVIRTYSITDPCGNQIFVNQTITVNDTIPPTASNLTAIQVACIEDVPLPDVNVVTDETDNCVGPVVVSFFGDLSDGGSCPETVSRTYRISDVCGNVSFVSQIITIQDDIPPTGSKT